MRCTATFRSSTFTNISSQKSVIDLSQPLDWLLLQKSERLRKFLKISLRVLLGILILVLLLWGLLQTEAGQNWLAGQVTKRLSKNLQTHISIRHVKIGLFNFNHMDLEGLLVEDQQKDTLLYAGKFQVRITDWFVLKDKAELKYIGLEDATIHMNRSKDSIWNYHFLETYFASTDTSAKKNAGIQFDLQKVVLKNVHFIKKDGWLGADMMVNVGSLDMDVNKISVTGKTVDVRNVVITDPYVSMLNYEGKFIPPDIKTPQEWNIRFGNVELRNGRFRNDKDNYAATTPYFDGKHIDFSNINGSLKNIGWTADTITGTINLTTRERSGLQVKSLKARTTIHPQAMVFDDFHLQLNNSVLEDYFSMRYSDIGKMDDFLHAVTMEARFNNASVSSDDIGFFAPELKSWKRTIRLNGDIKGTVDALASKDIEIWAGRNTYVHGAVSLVGLPNINETLINVEAKDLRTTYADAASFIPDVRKINMPDLKKISYLRFRGTYTGFINDFVSYGTIQTNLGTLQTDINMKFPKNGDPVYSGRISTDGFAVGSFVDNPSLGLVDFHGTVKGHGFDYKTMDMTVDGIIHKFQYENYTYQNITAKGTLARRLFSGDFLIRDPNADLHLKGVVDLTGTKPYFDVTADINKANLKILQVTDDDLQLSGKFGLNIHASSLSDMLGTARISNAMLTRSGKSISFDSLIVSSGYVDGLKKLRAVSSEFDATVTGDFDIKALPKAFTLFLSRYYPAYIKAPVAVTPQAFTFDITTGIVEDYVKLIDSSLTGFNNSHITGSLNTAANTMTVDADIPHIGYKQYDFSDLQLKGSGDLEKLTMTGQVGNAQVGDSLFFPTTSLSIRAQNDVSDITVNTSSNQAINQANLSAQIKTFSDGASVAFNPSTFVLNGKTWTVEQGGELNFRKNSVVQGQLMLRESNQEIKVWTELDHIGDWNNLHVALKNINIGDISPFITKKDRLEGLLSGDIIVEDPQNRFNIHSDLRTDELRVNADSVGTIRATVDYNNKTGLLTGSGFNIDTAHHLNFNLAFNLKDTANTFQNRINTTLTNFELKYLNRFLGSIFSNINGYVTGNLDITEDGDAFAYTGKAKLRDASFRVNFTQVKYNIDNTDIELKKNLLDLSGIHLRDTLGNGATVSGTIRHHAFQDMDFDLTVKSESDRMMLLNTSYRDNQQFFGTARGSGTFTLLGSQRDMLMDIDVKASERDTGNITLPPVSSRQNGLDNFMVERKYGREMTPQEGVESSNLHFDVHLNANPKVNINVILDELTADVIKARGNGNLRITSGTSEPLTLQGRYDIDEGSYDFSFQALLKKPFDLKKGSNNYIEWNGDPYDAKVHLDAVYTTTNQVSFAPLAGTLFPTGSLSVSNLRDYVTVEAILTGSLFHPDFNFKLDFDPRKNTLYSNPEFAFAIQQIQNNQNELNKQVTYLIVFNSFAPFENATTNTADPFSEFTYSTISGLLFGKVNEQLNKLFSKILKNNNATFNITGSLYNRNVFDPNTKGRLIPNQSNVGISFGVPLFNDRAHLTVGGSFDVPIASDIQQTIRLFPDVVLELLVNKSGSVKATFFYKQNVDFLSGNTTATGLQPRRYGAGIGYGKDFNSIGDLFGKKKSKQKKETVVPPADSTNKKQ